jgi:hypothetical protein
MSGIKKGMISGAGLGLTYLTMFSCWCLAFWYGGKLQIANEITVGTLVIVSTKFNSSCDCD